MILINISNVNFTPWCEIDVDGSEIVNRFEILEHKADLRIRVFSRNKKELFLNALLGMTAGLRPETKSAKREIRKIKTTSPDLNALLVDFLNEALYFIQTNKEIYDKVKFTKFSDTGIEAELSGRKIKSFGEDIKAATHHGLNIRRTKDGFFEVIILFDI